MGREKSPGLKILWIWTIGTAAIMVTNVVRTRLKDSETMMKHEQLDQNQIQSCSTADSLLADETILFDSDQGIVKELK